MEKASKRGDKRNKKQGVAEEDNWKKRKWQRNNKKGKKIKAKKQEKKQKR